QLVGGFDHRPVSRVYGGEREVRQTVERRGVLDQALPALGGILRVRLQERVRRDLQQQRVAREQHAAGRLVQADVAGGVARKVQHLQVEAVEGQSIAVP